MVYKIKRTKFLKLNNCIEKYNFKFYKIDRRHKSNIITFLNSLNFKYFKKFEKIIKNNDFTLGEEVDIFAKQYVPKLLNQKYVVAVGSGTDALMLSLKCLGVKEGDEVITTPNF